MSTDGKTPDERIRELMAARNITVYRLAGMTGLSENGTKLVVKGRTKSPTIQTVDAIASALDTTRDYILYGRDPDEDDITTMEQLHAWEMRIVRQRERYIERILAMRRSGLTPEQDALVDLAQADTLPAEDQANPESDDPPPGDSAA